MSNKLNTKDIKTGGGGTAKTLQPSNVVCTVSGIQLEEFKLKPGAYNIILNLEGPDLGKDFEGFFIDKDDESKGRSKGQVGKVKASEWAFSDGTTKNGIEISRDTEILKFIKNFCIAFDCVPWLDAQDNKHDTIESLVNTLIKDKPFTGKPIEFCIAGKEYLNKQGYVQHDLFLPKYTKLGVPFGKSRVLTFDPNEHIRKKKVEVVQEFGDAETPSIENNDFSLD